MTILVEQTPTGKYILRFNASLYKESNCLRKVWFTMFRGLVSEGGDKDFKMEYGTAFHKALHLYYMGQPLQSCIDTAFNHYSQPSIHIPDTDWRSVSHLVNCVMQYDKYWKRAGDLITPDIGSDGQPMLEIPFAYPFYSTSLVDVLLSGTIDFRGTFSNSYKVIVDHKTTSLNAKESYLNSYVLSPQLMTYKMVHEMLFPGIPVQCMINGIFLSRTNKNDFLRSSLIDFTPHQMTQHRNQLTYAIESIVNRFEMWIQSQTQERLDSMFPENYTCCDQKYGMCQYLPLCMAQSPEDQEGIITTSYGQRIYDPSKFQA